MTNDPQLKDPTNRIVCVFDDPTDLQAAWRGLAEMGIEKDRMRTFHGESKADDVDMSAKWFADTDLEIGKYKRELEMGNSVLTVPVDEDDQREPIVELVKKHNARRVTHFGQWLMEMI